MSRLIDGDKLMMSIADWWYSSFGEDETDESKAIRKVMDKVEESLDKFIVPQWIHCSERLPDISKSVLICDIDGDIYLGHRTRFGDYYQDIGDHRIKNVTAWMPLPEPYKEGQE